MADKSYKEVYRYDFDGGSAFVEKNVEVTYRVLKGSAVNQKNEGNYNKDIRIMRDMYSECIDDDGKLTKDVLFERESNAAKFVAGYNTSGSIFKKVDKK